MLRDLYKSEFFRNVFTLFSGTAIAQSIPLIISPVLSRIYTPQDFGVLALFVSIGALIGVIASGRYELAIMLPESKRDAYNVLALSLGLSTITAFFTLLLVVLLKQYISGLLHEPEISKWLYAVPVVVICTGYYQAFNYWSTRKKTYMENAVSRISQAGTTATANLLLGIARTGPSGLIVGYIAGLLTACLVLGYRIFSNLKEFRANISMKEMIENARRYKNFLQINTPHAFIDSLQENGIIYFIISFFSRTILGLYSFSYRILKAPIGLIGNAIYQVFYQKASIAIQEGQSIQPLVRRIYLNLFLLGFPVFLILIFFTPAIFSFIFGKQWLVSGEIAQILMPWIFLNFLASPVSCLTVIMNKQKQAMIFTLADIILKLSSITIGGVYGNFKLGFILMSFFGSILMIFALIWYYRIAGNTEKNTY